MDLLAVRPELFYLSCAPAVAIGCIPHQAEVSRWDPAMTDQVHSTPRAAGLSPWTGLQVSTSEHWFQSLLNQCSDAIGHALGLLNPEFPPPALGVQPYHDLPRKRGRRG
jgi:hypothetical protein